MAEVTKKKKMSSVTQFQFNDATSLKFFSTGVCTSEKVLKIQP